MRRLDAYLYGEQIGQALIGHSELKPQLLVTDQRAVLAVRSFRARSLWSVWTVGPDAPVRLRRAAAWAQSGVCRPAAIGEDPERIVTLYEQVLPEWNVEEPFQRIHEAITELQKAA